MAEGRERAPVGRYRSAGRHLDKRERARERGEREREDKDGIRRVFMRGGTTDLTFRGEEGMVVCMRRTPIKKPDTKERKNPDSFFKITQLEGRCHDKPNSIVKFDDYAHKTLQAKRPFGNPVNHVSGYIRGSNDLDYSEHFALQKIFKSIFKRLGGTAALERGPLSLERRRAEAGRGERGTTAPPLSGGVGRWKLAISSDALLCPVASSDGIKATTHECGPTCNEEHVAKVGYANLRRPSGVHTSNIPGQSPQDTGFEKNKFVRPNNVACMHGSFWVGGVACSTSRQGNATQACPMNSDTRPAYQCCLLTDRTHTLINFTSKYHDSLMEKKQEKMIGTELSLFQARIGTRRLSYLSPQLSLWNPRPNRQIPTPKTETGRVSIARTSKKKLAANEVDTGHSARLPDSLKSQSSLAH
uniref:Uncharacterized protein n=1 Tax=Oryza punctata TaxID=4537 RepID=A0A0E0KJ85_ORYPU